MMKGSNMLAIGIRSDQKLDELLDDDDEDELDSTGILLTSFDRWVNVDST